MTEQSKYDYDTIIHLAIKNSIFFDFDYYYSNCHDLQGLDPISHYLKIGYKEGLNPSLFFSTNAYYEQNPDVYRIGMNPLEHFLLNGNTDIRFLNRQMEKDYNLIYGSGQFDEYFYLDSYLNKTVIISDPLWHFIIYGVYNCNNPNKYFDIIKFKYQNPSIQNDENIFAYYIRNKYTEKLFINKAQLHEYNSIINSGLFNSEFYTKRYKISKVDPILHYITEGYKNKYNPSQTFFNDEYIKLNSDIDYHNISPLGHYCLYGKKEGRFCTLGDKIYSTIKNSKLFDKDYYLKSLPNGVDPYQHYIQYGNNEGRNPSTNFNTREYLALNPDVFLQKINALYHYETSGKIQHRETSFSSITEPIDFPENSLETEGEGTFIGSGTGRIAIFASFDGSGELPRRARYYLKAMQPWCDSIILVMDNPVLFEAVDDIKAYCTYYICRRHEMYDFGSYKLGLEHVYDTMKLENIREIVLCNDSMYGPIDGFDMVFDKMDSKACDFWGLSISHTTYYTALQSFFYGIRRRVFMSNAFRMFFKNVRHETNRAFIVTKYELNFTEYLRDHNFTFASFIDDSDEFCPIPTKQPLTCISKHHFPLIKRKTIFEDCLDDKRAVLDFVKGRNEKLYDIMLEEGCETHLLKERKRQASTSSPYLLIKNSHFFDRDYYLRNNIDVDLEGIDPIEHYLSIDCENAPDPSADFSSKGYRIIYPDVIIAGLNPLLHYERYGFINRVTTLPKFESQSRVAFPDEAIDVELKLQDMPEKTKRVAIFASFSKEGRFADYVIYYLRQLKQSVDYILVVSDNPVLPDETDRLKGVADYVIAHRHGLYDFGSYACGVEKLHQLTQYDLIEEIVLCNDSCVGPIEGFVPMFNAMRRKQLDLWSITKNSFGSEHLQSFFLVCGQKVIQSDAFYKFMKTVKKEYSPWNVIIKYEIGFSRIFLQADYRYDTWVHFDDARNPILNHYEALMHGMPIVKVKYLSSETDDKKNYERVLNFIEDRDETLYTIIKRDFLSKNQEQMPCGPTDKEKTTNATFPSLKTGEKICIHFYVQNISMFAARALFEKMLNMPSVTSVCVVIPDTRFGAEYEEKTRISTYSELAGSYGEEAVLKSWDEATGEYLNLSDIPDIVCYSSSYDSTHEFFSVKYVSTKKRTMLINYGFFRSQYDRTIYRRNSYSMFWKVFLETEYNMEEARKYTINQAKNCEVVGYAKMDALAAAMKKRKTEAAPQQKTILIAPHHSIPSGHNKLMQLSTFLKYYAFYLRLPLLFPKCKFIFRPHPMLFDLLAKPQFWGRQKVDDWLKRLTSHDNIELNETSDYFDVFARSDAMIHDCGSFLVEYFYTKKPQCYLLTEHHEERYIFVKLGLECLRRVYKAYNPIQITSFINTVVLNGNDVLRQERNHFAETVIMRNYPHVCDKIIDAIQSELPISNQT